MQFNGSTRRVELVGEGYFQVVHDEKIPFVVWASGVDITVLGTEFNVSNYPESKDVQTTLIEGKVSVTPLQCANTHVLLPGEQAMFDKKKWENNCSGGRCFLCCRLERRTFAVQRSSFKRDYGFYFPLV